MARYNVNPKQWEAAGAGGAWLFGREIIADHSDFFGGDHEPRGILLPVILNQAIAVGCAESFRLPEAR